MYKYAYMYTYIDWDLMITVYLCGQSAKHRTSDLVVTGSPPSAVTRHNLYVMCCWLLSQIS